MVQSIIPTQVVAPLLVSLSLWVGSAAAQELSLSDQQVQQLETVYSFIWDQPLASAEKNTIVTFYSSLQTENPQEFQQGLQWIEEAATSIGQLMQNNPPSYGIAGAREYLQQGIFANQSHVTLSSDMQALFEQQPGVLAADPSTGYLYTEADLEGFFDLSHFIVEEAGHSTSVQMPAVATVADKIAQAFPQLSPPQQYAQSQWNIIWLALQSVHSRFTPQRADLFSQGSDYLLNLHEVTDIRQAPNAFWQDFFVMMGALEQANDQQVIALLQSTVPQSELPSTQPPAQPPNGDEDYQRALDQWVNSSSRPSTSSERVTSPTALGDTLQGWINQGRQEAADRLERVEAWERDFNERLAGMSPMERAMVSYMGTSAGLRTAGNAGVMFWQ